MAGFQGMDVTAVRSLSNQMNHSADQIDQLMKQLTNSLNSTDWRGPDREQFLNNWQSQHVAQLNNVCNGLREASQTANRNANEQESASGH